MKFRQNIKIEGMMKNVISQVAQQTMQQFALYIAYNNFKSPLTLQFWWVSPLAINLTVRLESESVIDT